MEKSPVEVALLVIAGLIDGSERRKEAIAPLRAAVAAAIDELDPDRLRDSRPTWWQEMDRWVRLDAFDRLRYSADQIFVLEEQAEEIVRGLHEMLTPRAVGQWTYRRDYRTLCRMAEQRGVHLERLRLAERRLRPRLAAGTSAQLREARRQLVAEEKRGGRQRDRLGQLLSMADHVLAS